MSHPWGCRQLHTGQFHLAHCKMEKQAGSDEARLCTQWLSRGAFLLQMGFWAVSGSRLHPSMKAESKHSYLRGGSSWGRYASIQHSISLQYFPSIKKTHNPLCQTAPALHPAQHDLEKPTGSLSPHSVEHAVTEPRSLASMAGMWDSFSRLMIMVLHFSSCQSSPEACLFCPSPECAAACLGWGSITANSTAAAFGDGREILSVLTFNDKMHTAFFLTKVTRNRAI